ncbi:hypothetical protein [Siphonobacter sp. SORGH_AS_0500]|uniref:hypothetical protein n=1 Tax=Siphonobacter sp. SORGH_AS_0500 TaxID=1864824 RepID=UPI0028612796|nr:hypothetical protein [Siphonobacter sp. SORGH_AS_0500]MDR6196173.1 hypothetical protein [Siphonobacter sp. SORGH_AS_0500]
MKYIILVNSNKIGRNNLQTDIQDHLNRIDRKTIEEPNQLFLSLVDKVGELNANNPRCTPVTISRSLKTLFHFEERSKVESIFSSVKLVEIGEPLELNPEYK